MNNFLSAYTLIKSDKRKERFDIILEPLAKFNGDVMYFKSSHDARDYIEKLYVNSGVDAVEYDDDGLEIIRVQ